MLLGLLLAPAAAHVVILITDAALRPVCKDVDSKRFFEQIRDIKLKFKIVVAVGRAVAHIGQALLEGKLHLEVLVVHLTRDEGCRDCQAAQGLAAMLAAKRPLIEVPLIETLVS